MDSILEAAVRTAAFYFIKGLVCEARYSKYVRVPSVVSPMGDKIGYIVDGQLVTDEQMRGVLKDE